jgi:L-lactate dehydrogenase complex protein LldG
MSARDEVLARIRAALADDGQVNGHRGGHPGGDGSAPSYRTQGDLTGETLLDLLAGRLTDYRAVVRRTTEAELGAAVGAALEQRGVRRVVLPPGLSLPGLPAGV